MRRTVFFVVLLLAASAVSALAATVESAQAHRKASTYSQRSRHSSSLSAAKRSSAHSRSRTTGRAAIHAARYTPARASARSRYSVRNGSDRYPVSNSDRHSTGHESKGYDSGRVAVIREIAAREAQLQHSSHRPAAASRTTEVASLSQPAIQRTVIPQPAVSQPVVRQPASAPPPGHPVTSDNSVLADNSADNSLYNSGNEAPATDRQPPAIRQSSAAPVAGVSNPADATHQLSPGEASELPFKHQPADASASQPASTPASATAPQADQPESAATARELSHDNVDSDTPPPTEVASLDLRTAGMPSSLRGSLASLQRQNSMLESEGLERILDETDLSSRIEHGLLVPVPVSANLTVNPNLIENHRYCRPWTARFLTDLARAHAAAFHRPIEVNSAVRTVEYQTHLMRVNSNAAAAEGDIVSPHLTGATIDIAKQGMTHAELVWMRRYLLGIQDAGKIDVEEEFRQACFHISVYKTYSPSAPSHKAAQPAVRDAANHHKSTTPGASLPASIATGGLVPSGR